MKFYVECCKPKDKDTLYHALKVDFGYRVATLFNIDKDIICELADVSPKQIYQMKVGDKLEVGNVMKIGK